MQRSWIAAGVVTATLLALAAQANIVTRTGFLAGDFRAFYCAARVASTGADPYRTQPLNTCERSIGPRVFFHKNPGVTIPAPLPGYAIATLEPFSLLPFGIAAGLWALLLLLAWLAAVVALSRFAQLPWESALAAFALSLGTLSLPFGEVVPLSVACICLSGYFAWKARWQAAALFGTVAMIEPHLGLPLCIALAIWAPATRWVLAAGFAALAAISLFAVGLPVNLEYFTSVLPAHALSELTRDTQYSASAVFAALGMTPNAAVRAGGLWYGAMVIAGTVVAGKLARKSGNAAYLACIPPAFAVFGGSFIHITQIAVAIPAAILLVGDARPPQRAWAIAALLLLVVPWGWVVSPALIVAPVVPVAVLTWAYSGRNATATLLAAIGAAAMVFGLQHLYTFAGPHFGAHAALPPMDPRLPEASWSAYSLRSSAGSLAAWAVRIPTWTALAMLVALLTDAARPFGLRRQGVAAAAIALICITLPIAAQLNADRSSGWLGVDFRAYYCAALAQREGANPYYAGSLHACEAAAVAPFYRAAPNVTVPAPYPPYVLAMLAPLSLLPFAAAAAVWWTMLIAAIGFAMYALARVARVPFAVAAGALGLSLGLTTLSPANMLPLGIAGIVAAAWAAANGRTAWTIAAVTLAMVEPQIALPAAVALFVAYPATRVAMLASLALLGALAVAVAGLPQTLAYLGSVLPAHALAEVSRDNQYSLATIAAAAGLQDRAAVLLGSISYAAMTALGVIVGMRLARRYGEPAFVLLVPPAFALLGGSFVHTAEIAAAVPAALLLAVRAQTQRTLFIAALVLLAVPWMNATSITLFIAPFFPVAYLVFTLAGRERTPALAAALASFAAIAVLFMLAASSHGHVPVARVHPPIDPRLAEASWRAFVLADSTNAPIMWLLRLPSWIGLLALTIPAALLARKRRLLPSPAGAGAAA